MLKIYSLSIALLSIAILLACSDPKEKPTVKTENPLSGYLTIANFTKTVINEDGPYELGFTFSPSTPGTITKFIAQLPTSASDLRITLWDVESEEPIHTETISSITADTEASVEITPISLEAEKEYSISINAISYYRHTKEDLSAVTYPVTVDHIIIKGYSFSEGSEQVFPNESHPLTSYEGDVSFVFQPTE